MDLEGAMIKYKYLDMDDEVLYEDHGEFEEAFLLRRDWSEWGFGSPVRRYILNQGDNIIIHSSSVEPFNVEDIMRLLEKLSVKEVV